MSWRLSISQKLMLALLGLTLIVLVATLGLARWSFERGFLDYVNALEQTRLSTISEDVAQIYSENGKKWQGVDEVRLARLINVIPKGSPHFRPGPPRKRKPPPPGGRRQEKRNHAAMPLPNPPRRKRRGPSSPPTTLYDLQGNRIAGSASARLESESINVPVIVNGQSVAMLKSEPKRRFSSSVETAFSRQQWIASGVIGIASLLLAALVSWGLVGLLLFPVRRMIDNIKRLSKGDYSQLPHNSFDRQDEFGQLMGDIDHLTYTLEKNQSSRRRWIADISHELRTPLTVLTGEIEALKDGVRPFNQKQLESLDQEVQRLRHLTDDLYELSVSDIGGLRYELTPMDMTKCVTQAIKSHQLITEKKGIVMSFEGDANLMINADKKRINQLLSNLINNSVAYTDAPGRMDFVLKRNRGNMQLSLTDTPPGVTLAECSQLFEPLYRQDSSRTRRGSGAGLGLAICQNIVEGHRGTIIAKPSTQGGLQIIIELPLTALGVS